VTFLVRSETLATSSERDPTVWILEHDRERADIWPAQGFNCFRWWTAEHEILYADPQFLAGTASPTRSGIPILFPFPNRVAGGEFTWDGQTYQLPLNDPAGKNAIHGFTCRRPWRIVDNGCDADSAWLTGEFHAATDAPDCSPLWPADYRLRLTYRLLPGALRLEAHVDNPDARPLPFGLGYHPYFLVAPPEVCTVRVPAHRYWELEESLPTGNRVVLDRTRNLNEDRAFVDLTVDEVLTDLPRSAEQLPERGVVRRGTLSVGLLGSPAFREMVVFTPPHREAVCLEPYTCTTDAINLQQRGIDAGLRVLAPGEAWSAIVELHAALSP
jgi:aldose 1-epimerase